MNISPTLPQHPISFFIKKFIDSSTDQQKRIFTIVSIAFSCLIICYMFSNYCYLNTRKHKPIKSKGNQFLPQTLQHSCSNKIEKRKISQKKEPFKALLKIDRFKNISKEMNVSIFTYLNLKEWNCFLQVNQFLKNLSQHPLIMSTLLEKRLVPLEKRLEIAKKASSQLADLDLQEGEVKDQELINTFATCVNIRHLNLAFCINLTQKVFNHFPAKLHSLDLSGLVIAPGALNPLSLSTTMRSLDLSGCVLTGTDLHYLSKDLHTLSLAGCIIRDADILHLPKDLKDLNLAGCMISDWVIPHLPKNLKVLNLCGCVNLTGVTFKQLSKNLISLNLAWCTNLIESYLGDLSSDLQFINLSYCHQLTVEVVKKLPLRLQSVKVFWCKKITNTSKAKQLNKVRPGFLVSGFCV